MTHAKSEMARVASQCVVIEERTSDDPESVTHAGTPNREGDVATLGSITFSHGGHARRGFRERRPLGSKRPLTYGSKKN